MFPGTTASASSPRDCPRLVGSSKYKLPSTGSEPAPYLIRGRTVAGKMPAFQIRVPTNLGQVPLPPITPKAVLSACSEFLSREDSPERAKHNHTLLLSLLCISVHMIESRADSYEGFRAGTLEDDKASVDGILPAGTMINEGYKCTGPGCYSHYSDNYLQQGLPC